MVDQLGVLTADMQLAKEVLESYADMENALKKEFSDVAGAEIGIRIEGDKYVADLSKKGNKTEVLVKTDKIIPVLTQNIFNLVAKIGVGDLKKYLSEEELKGILKVLPAGPRKLTLSIK